MKPIGFAFDVRPASVYLVEKWTIISIIVVPDVIFRTVPIFLQPQSLFFVFPWIA